MKLNRSLVAGAYLISALLVVVPLAETAPATWPMRVSETAWRFGSAGLYSRALLTPLLGLLLALLLASASGHRRTLRALAILAGLAAVLLIGALGLFSLDALEMRAQVNPEAKAGFDVASVTAAAKMLAGAVTAAFLALGGWKAARQRTPAPDRLPGAVLVRSRKT